MREREVEWRERERGEGGEEREGNLCNWRGRHRACNPE